MASLETITAFVGWCAVVNIGVLILALIAIGLMHDFIGELTGKIFGVGSEDTKIVLLTVFQQYRLAVIFLNLVPYIVLKIMAAT